MKTAFIAALAFATTTLKEGQAAPQNCYGREDYNETIQDIPDKYQRCLVFTIVAIHNFDTESAKSCCITPLMGISKENNIMYDIYYTLDNIPALKAGVQLNDRLKSWSFNGKFLDLQTLVDQAGDNFYKIMSCALTGFKKMKNVCPKSYTNEGQSSEYSLDKIIHFIGLFLKQMKEKNITDETSMFNMIKEKNKKGEYNRGKKSPYGEWDGDWWYGKFYH